MTRSRPHVTLWSLRATGLAGLVLAAVILLGAPAQAHTDLLSSDPRDGARLDTAPTALTLTFNEDISPDLSTVVLSVGERSLGALTLEQGASPSGLVAEVPVDAVPEGSTETRWVATYRVTSLDGHAVEGTVSFRAPAARVTEQPSPTSTPPGSSPSPTASGSTPSVPEAVDRSSPAGSATSTLVIAGLTVIGVAISCGLLVRARRRADEP